MVDQSIKWQFNAYTSSPVWDEVEYVVRKVAGIEESIKVGKILIKMTFLEFVDVNYDTCENALRLVEKYKLLPRDAIHTTLALKHCDGVIISNDTDFDTVKVLKRIF